MTPGRLPIDAQQVEASAIVVRPRSRRRWRTMVVAVTTGLVLAACGTSIPNQESGETIPDADTIAAGSDLYRANCAACHGTDLRGTTNGPSHLSIVYEPNHHGDAAFKLAVQRGAPSHHWDFGNMPPIEGLSADEVESIIAFVRETQRNEGFEPYPP